MQSPLLVFDLDGTLFRSEDVFVPAISRTLRQYGLPVPSRSEILSFLTMTSTEFVRRITAGTSVSHDEFQREFRSRERAAIPTDGRLYPGIAETLTNLHDDGFEMAICSNGSAKYVEIVLEALGIRSLFESCATNDRNVAKAELLRELLSDDRPAVMVGDSPGDHAAAAACRVPFVYAAYGYGTIASEEADTVCDAPESLSAVVRFASAAASVELALPRFSERPSLLGVNGIDCAGKTTFAVALTDFLRRRGRRVCIVHGDDFHNPRAVRRSADDEVGVYLEHAFDYDSLVREILAPARAGGVNTRLRLIDLETDARTVEREYAARPGDVVIVEGVYLFRPPLVDLFDLLVYLDVAWDDALEKAAARDDGVFDEDARTRYLRKYFPAQRAYIARHDPAGAAHLVFTRNGTGGIVPVTTT